VTCYYDFGNGNLKAATIVDGSWVQEAILSEGNIGAHPAMIVDSLGMRHFSYQNVDRTSLEFAGLAMPSFAWDFDIIDNGTGPMFPSVKVDIGADLMVAYHDGGPGWLKFARLDLGDWIIETVDTSGHVGGHTSVASSHIDSTLMISYYDEDSTNLKLARTMASEEDCCEGLTGNVDGDLAGNVDLPDVIYLVNALFLGGPAAACMAEANVDGDAQCNVDLPDVIYLVNALFLGGPAPAPCMSECE
jgi:hypothetical protein